MSMIYDMMSKLSKEGKSGIFSIITSSGNSIFLTISTGKLNAAIWQTKDGKAIPLWFYIQTDSEIIGDEEFAGLEKTAQEKGLSPGELLSSTGNLSPEKRIRFIKSKIRDIAFNVFSLKNDEIQGTTFAENELLYPKSELEIEEDIESLWNDYHKAVENMELIVESIGDEETLVSVNNISMDTLNREEKFLYNFIGNKKYLSEILCLPIPSRVKIYKILASLNRKKAVALIKKRSQTLSPEKKIEFNIISAFFFLVVIFIIGASLTTAAFFLSKDQQKDSNTRLEHFQKRAIERETLSAVVTEGIYPYQDRLETENLTITFRRIGGKIFYDTEKR
ncbi:hypothetical protein JW890_01700 [candidate division WOR-3 bacterium]|nr:hypothetical protein [candidate division WOR-3 bacterium]